MLLTFNITNFKGFKNLQTFDLIATPANEYQENLYEIDNNIRVNKNACIIGPNSSGKTHLLKAIESFSSSIKSVESISDAHQPFLLDELQVKFPTIYEGLFYDTDRNEYLNYSFSVLSGKIVHESLAIRNKRKNAKLKYIFKRDNEKITFSKEFKAIGDLVSETIDDGGLIINYAASIKNDSIKFIYAWAKSVFLFNPRIINNIASQIIDSLVESIENVEEKKEGDKEENKKIVFRQVMKNINKSLKGLDLPIEKVEHKFTEKGKAYLNIIPITNKGTKINLSITEARDFLSEGAFSTLNIAIVIELFSYSKSTLLIDEFDGALHHKLSLGVLELIRSKDKINVSQMIMSTHDILLLDDHFRRDSVFVLMKDSSYSTRITRVSEFSVRKDAKLSLKYLSNEFGALPKIMSIK